MSTQPFDPDAYKRNTRDQWDESGAGYDAWGDTIRTLVQPAAEQLLEALDLQSGDSVLELACGGGVLTLILAERVGAEGQVLATDISPGMVALARANADSAGFSQVETSEMDGEVFDLGDRSFNSVVSSLGLMFFPNPEASLRSQVQVVSPGGHVGAIVISEPAANPFFAVPAQIISKRAGIAPPSPGMPGPFALGAPGRLASLFEAAGMSKVASSTIPSAIRLESVNEHLRFLKDAFGALHMLMTGMSEEEKADTWGAVAEALSVYEGPDGFVSPSELVICTGTVG